jgi:arylsulfatase A-like enzyme
MKEIHGRREFLWRLGVGSAALSWAGCDATTTESAAPARGGLPNIIFLMADDMGYGDPGCYNSASKIPTPNMDRLAAQGMRFTDAHSPSAVCTPTRYGVLTGRYAWRTRLTSGVLSGYSPSLVEPGRLTVASILKEHGYHTAGVGKWHLGLNWAAKRRPADNPLLESANFAKPEGLEVDFSKPVTGGPAALGFDYFYGIPASLDMAPYVYLENDRTTELADARTAGIRDGGVFWREGEKSPGFEFIDVLPHLTDKALGFIEEHVQNSPQQPFFLYFAPTGPHTPWMPTAEVEGRSGAGKYGDFVVLVDQMIGRVMDALDRHNLAENTLLIVTSDNGSDWKPEHIQQFGHYSNHEMLRGRKRDAWDGGHRVPFLARWPARVPAGVTSEETICLTDLTATAAAIIGQRLPPDAAEDSYSILPALLGETRQEPLREATVLHSADGMFAIRQGPWKLIDGQGPGSANYGAWKPAPNDPPGQLYDMTADVSERENVYGRHPEVVARLKGLLDRYRQQGHSRPL